MGGSQAAIIWCRPRREAASKAWALEPGFPTTWGGREAVLFAIWLSWIMIPYNCRWRRGFDSLHPLTIKSLSQSVDTHSGKYQPIHTRCHTS